MSAILGVDIGGTHVRVGFEGDPDVLVVPTPGTLAELPDLLVAHAGHPAAVGVGCAGLVDHRRGVVRWMPHAGGRDLALGPILRDRLGVPVWVDNDATCAALAEARTGAGVGHRMVLTVTVGTGIGAGLVIDGAVERGRGHLGEVGHMRIASTGDCPCGRTGCWEEHASGRALDRAARTLEPGTDGSWLVQRAAAGDEAARAALAPVARALLTGIENLVLAFDPDVVVLGGIIPAAGPVLVEAITGGVRDGGLAVTGLPPIVPARHGDRAGLEGAIIGVKEALA